MESERILVVCLHCWTKTLPIKEIPRPFYESFKKVYGFKEAWTYPVLSSDCQVLHNDKYEILSQWRELFENILNSDFFIQTTLGHQYPEIPELIPPWLKCRIPLNKSRKRSYYFRNLWRWGNLVWGFLHVIVIWKIKVIALELQRSDHLFKNKGNKIECDNSQNISFLHDWGKSFSCVVS